MSGKLRFTDRVPKPIGSHRIADVFGELRAEGLAELIERSVASLLSGDGSPNRPQGGHGLGQFKLVPDDLLRGTLCSAAVEEGLSTAMRSESRPWTLSSVLGSRVTT